MDEPSLLDYLKARLTFWKANPYDILVADLLLPEIDEPELAASARVDQNDEYDSISNLPSAESSLAVENETPEIHENNPIRVPWRSLTAALLAFTGQFDLSPGPNRDGSIGVVLLVFAIAMLIWAYMTGEISLVSKPEGSLNIPNPGINLRHLGIAGLFAIISLLSFSNLEFSFLNLALLAITTWLMIRAFYSTELGKDAQRQRIQKQKSHLPWKIEISSRTLIALGAFALIAFFRFYRLADVPPEMNSDHAEKILDVLRILGGENKIFFSSNGGREALQFYIVAALHSWFNLPLGFLILKIATSIIGISALPFIYLLGKELGSERVGLLAALFAGIAYWPNVVARVGLRLPFYMLFTAAVVYFLMRGLRRNNRNDFILAGLSLGISLYGYAADRILPLLVIAILALYMLHMRSAEKNRFALFALLVLVAVSFSIFIPLFRYIIAEPHSFLMRMGTRMGSWEQPITESPLRIFLENNLKAFAMFSWDAGVVWPISIPGYPALSTISGGLFYIGFGMVFIRYIKKHAWSDGALLLMIPILMLPSTLSIAFPSENPNLYRTGGVILPVFLLIALAADGLMTALERGIPASWGKRLAAGLILFLLLINAFQDYNLVFKEYLRNYQRSSWNSSEMGAAARSFISVHHLPDNVWVVGYPNWVDTRLVAINAGYPGRDYELKMENISATLAFIGPKLFILNPEDTAALETLQRYYPLGRLERVASNIEGKDFLQYFTPSDEG